MARRQSTSRESDSKRVRARAQMGSNLELKAPPGDRFSILNRWAYALMASSIQIQSILQTALQANYPSLMQLMHLQNQTLERKSHSRQSLA